MRHHYLLDVVTETVGQPSSILIRALEPIASIEIMQGLRKTPGLLKLTSGPGRLCQALGIDQRLNLHDLTDEHSSLFIAAEWHVVRSEMIGTSARTGISKNADAPLRFFAKDNPYVSGRS